MSFGSQENLIFIVEVCYIVKKRRYKRMYIADNIKNKRTTYSQSGFDFI